MSLGRLISFRPKGQRLAKSFFEFQRYVPHAFERPFDWVSLEVSCASLFCVIRIYTEFIRRFYLLLNVCSFEEILDRSCTRIIYFGPAAPSTYSSQVSRPSNYLFRANSAFETFEAGFRSLELFPFGPAAPSRHSRQGFGPSNYFLLGQQRLQEIQRRAPVPRISSFRARSAFELFLSG
jgi:hypothetical protein